MLEIALRTAITDGLKRVLYMLPTMQFDEKGV
jgi:hypothetical protein